MTALEFSFSIVKSLPALRPFAMRLTRDREDALDLLQETVLKAFSNKEKFAEGTNLRAWLYTIMKNTFITNYQRMMRRNTFIDNTENQHYLNGSDNLTENLAYSSFALKDINNAIARLDKTYREPFLMHYKGFKYYEIADKLGIPIGTVKNRIHIARKELKQMLRQYQYN